MTHLEKEARAFILEQPLLARAVARVLAAKRGEAQKTNLTARQRDTLDFIRLYSEQNRGASPTFREIQAALNLSSVSRVGALIAGLEERGFIIRNPSRSRSIRVL